MRPADWKAPLAGREQVRAKIMIQCSRRVPALNLSFPRSALQFLNLAMCSTARECHQKLPAQILLSFAHEHALQLFSHPLSSFTPASFTLQRSHPLNPSATPLPLQPICSSNPPPRCSSTPRATRHHHPPLTSAARSSASDSTETTTAPSGGRACLKRQLLFRSSTCGWQ